MPGSSDPWLYSYRDDSPSPSPPKAVPKPRVPQTQMDCILAEAELDGLDSLAGGTDREVIDIGEVEEKVVYNDNPFRIAARQAMSKRVRAGDDQSGPERVGPKFRGSTAFLPNLPPVKKVTKGTGAIESGFQRQSDLSASRPVPSSPLPRPAKNPKSSSSLQRTPIEQPTQSDSPPVKKRRVLATVEDLPTTIASSPHVPVTSSRAAKTVESFTPLRPLQPPPLTLPAQSPVIDVAPRINPFVQQLLTSDTLIEDDHGSSPPSSTVFSHSSDTCEASHRSSTPSSFEHLSTPVKIPHRTAQHLAPPPKSSSHLPCPSKPLIGHPSQVYRSNFLSSFRHDSQNPPAEPRKSTTPLFSSPSRPIPRRTQPARSSSPSSTTWSTRTPIPTPSFYGSALPSSQSTSASLATKFSLPGLMPGKKTGGGAGGRMDFRPVESLAQFKARTAREAQHEDSATIGQGRVEKKGKETRGKSLYRNFDF